MAVSRSSDSGGDSYGSSPAANTAVAAHMEIQREIDAMQVVYTQERRRLEILIRELEEEHRLLRDRIRAREPSRLRSTSGGSAAESFGTVHPASVQDSADAGGLPGRQIRWRIEDPLRLLEGSSSGQVTKGVVAQDRFRVPECAGVSFGLTFLPQGETMTESSCCRFAFEVSGSMAEGLALDVNLWIDVEPASSSNHVARNASNGSGLARAQSGGNQTNGNVSVMNSQLHGAGQAWCDGPVLLDVCKLQNGSASQARVIVCCANFVVQSWNAPMIHHQTVWLQTSSRGESTASHASPLSTARTACLDSESSEEEDSD
eukprot:TRINITY_DN68424_c0_g1_i1.p1 TRINITY_DN68424_c0_g1~~TRINITY_DN68424_c0_g1_i1.p1  ORF type:complete len:343 (-),score=34.21 TRINITY_DN68424_c0_g1_i1:57-1007(-)